MLMRHDDVGDDGIRDVENVWELLQDRFQSVETPRVVTLVAQLARLQLQEAREAVSETLFNALLLNSLPLRYESFCFTEKLQPANELHRIEEKAAKLPWEHSTVT